MKLRLCLLLLVVILLLTEAAEGKRRKGRRRMKKKTSTTATTTTTTEVPELVPDDTSEETEEDELDLIMQDDEAEEEAEAAALQAVLTPEDTQDTEDTEDKGNTENTEEVQEDREEVQARLNHRAILERHQLTHDPCQKKRCGKGRECTLTEQAQPVCSCITRCSYESDPRRQVCSNHNETWNSDCRVYKQRCLCEDGGEGCLDDKNKHLHVEYYGQCRELKKCPEDEMADFPRRMREWLFNVMKDMAERRQLSALYSEMEQEAEEDEQKRWVNSAIWRWCELDSHPADSSVSRHELFPIRATLLAMEHCIAPFLEGCDMDGDHDISLKEWATCLNVTSGEIKERCERIKQEKL